MSVMFRDEVARQRIEAAYERFRGALPPMSSREIPTRHGDTHVLVGGTADGPPLVVLHGALASSAHVLRELGGLASRFRIFAPDIVGQSVKSADRRLDVSGPACGEWLADVLDGLGLDRPHVLGVSWGGFVALTLAALAPSRIERLVLIVPAGVVGGSAWEGFVKLGLPLALFRAFPTETRLRRFASALLSTMDDDWIAYFDDAFRAYRLDMRVPPLARPEALLAFDRPTLVFGAEEDVSFPGRALLDRAKILFPHAETELLARSKHSPPTDPVSRAELVRRIARFLDDRIQAAASPVVG